MKYIYDQIKSKKDTRLLAAINLAAERLAEKLKTLKIESLGISDYNQRYLSDKLESVTAELQRYSYLIFLVLHKLESPLTNLNFLEYGGGVGMLSLLAKELGFAKVIYNDIYDVSCIDAEMIGSTLGCKADYYVNGNIDDVLEFSRAMGLSYNVIASYDVIEHIYDMESFLAKLSCFRGYPLTVAMASGAVIFNKRYTKKIMKIQYEWEHYDRKPKFGQKERDTLRAYIDIRREIIREASVKISENDIEELTNRTRGLMKPHILDAVMVYLQNGQLPKILHHATNTCDPYTGNWKEHLMDPFELIKVLSDAGFKSEVFSGYYSYRYGLLIRRLLKRCANIFIRYTSTKYGIRISPYYTIFGRRE